MNAPTRTRWSAARRLQCLALASASLSLSAVAAPVVVTPGSLAGYAFFPPGSGSGGGSTTDPVKSLVTCYVTPSAGDTTLNLASRNSYGYTDPITVLYKMVGGGAGITRYQVSAVDHPQFNSAGGSSAIFKNGVAVATTRGMHGSEAASPTSVAPMTAGTFTVNPTDTLRFILGGGGGSGVIPYSYSGVFNYYAFPGGGGAGLYGGGSGTVMYSTTTYPPQASAVAFGGSASAGGAGDGPGASGQGGSNASGNAGRGGVGTSSGASGGASYWDGYQTSNWTIGGGGGQGQSGRPGGRPSCPVGQSDRLSTPPVATGFALDVTAGKAGQQFSFYDVYAGGYQSCIYGGGFGQIVLQYQARSCDFIPQYNQP